MKKNNQPKVLFVFGTRPEAIKMAPVIQAFIMKGIRTEVGITAQHREMLDQVINFFDLPVHYDLNIMQKGQTLNQLSGRLFHDIDIMLGASMPDIVFVHGDTTTSWITAMSSYHRGIKVAHVEAGLRTYDKFAPFPEEINRQIIGRIADYHFAPTKTSADHLLQEGVLNENISITGNTVIDALNIGLEKVSNGYLTADLSYVKNIIDASKKIILVTGHRRENFGDGFEDLCHAIANVVKDRPDIQVIYPVHLNPMVQEPVKRILGNLAHVHLIKPVDYPAFIYLMQQSYLILTDSGGIQEEAPALGKPVLLMRNTTERPEAIEAGTVILTGTDTNNIANHIIDLLDHSDQYERMSNATNPYGDGHASERIMEYCLNQIPMFNTLNNAQ